MILAGSFAILSEFFSDLGPIVFVRFKQVFFDGSMEGVPLFGTDAIVRSEIFFVAF